MRELNPAAPPELEQVIARCLEKERSARYQHASDVRDELKQIRRNMSSLTIPRKEIAERVAELAKTSRVPEVQKEKPAPQPTPRRRYLIAVVLLAIVVHAVEHPHRGPITQTTTR